MRYAPEKDVREATTFVASLLGRSLTSAEIGVRDGAHALGMLTVSQYLYLVDPYLPYLDGENHLSAETQHDHYLNVCEMLETPEVRDRATLIVKTSEIASQMFADQFFDFVYIDADHSHDSALADLRYWYPKVRLGGVLAGHDADLVWPALSGFCWDAHEDFRVFKDKDWALIRTCRTPEW